MEKTITRGDESAFATTDNGTELFTTWQGQKGLTKREYFAAMAMNGYISAGSTGMPDAQAIAGYAVEAADALIKALNTK